MPDPTPREVQHSPVSIAPPAASNEALRARELAVMKRRATGLLVVMAAVFVGLRLVEGDAEWLGYARAAAEGSMVGGLADWFAVTALFRHPLGLPIPHTAVIKARKDQFGETLGAFVQDNFLTPDALLQRVRAADVSGRASAWLSDRGNAEQVAGYVADAAVTMADVLKDEDVHRVLDEQLRRGVESLNVAPLAGRALRAMTADARHHDLLQAIVSGLDGVIEESRPALRERFGRESPWWLPDAVEDRIFERLLDGFTRLLTDVRDDPDHEVRNRFDKWIWDLADRLEQSSELGERGEALKQELLGHPAVRAWTASIWTDVKSALRAQAADPTSELRTRIADAVVAAGQRISTDATLATKVDEAVETAACYVAEHFHDEISAIVSGTIARWDPDETSRKLELLLGRDLQFIRINGTVVGGLAGVLIHGLAEALGQ